MNAYQVTIVMNDEKTRKRDVEVMYKELMGFIGSVKNQYLSQLLHSFFDNKEFERRFKFHSAA